MIWSGMDLHYSLLADHYSKPTTRCSPLAIYYTLPSTHYSPLTTHYSLLDTHSSLLATYYSPLTTHYSLLTTRYSLITTHHSLLTTHYSLLTTRYSLLTTHHSLLTAHYSLLITHCSLLTTHYSLLTRISAERLRSQQQLLPEMRVQLTLGYRPTSNVAGEEGGGGVAVVAGMQIQIPQPLPLFCFERFGDDGARKHLRSECDAASSECRSALAGLEDQERCFN